MVRSRRCAVLATATVRGPGERSSAMSSPPRPTTGDRAVLASPVPNDAPGEQGGSGIPGFSGPTRVRLPLFALVALGTVLIGVLPFPAGARAEILTALLLFFLLLTTAFA